MKTIAHLPVLLTALMLAGCPKDQNAIKRESKEFQHSPDTGCVAAALASVAGVTKVDHRREQGSRELTIAGLQKPEQVNRFEYEYGGTALNIYFVVRYDGRTTLHNGYRCQSCGRETFERLYPVMRRIESEVEQRCSLPGLVSGSREYCSGAGCIGD